ncbi:SpRPA12 [Cadophora sp. MPI-SDFR-AT-0126]|nr:SpRPA12 [Leotiomycetes sp. MPI-SDFR-AT-0126]
MAPRFCTDCGNILDISSEETVHCDCCGTVNENKTRFETTTTTSNNFPSALREKLTSKTQQLTSEDFEDTQKISRECPKCGAKEMAWSAVQLRSADEGTTIFYRCACGHRDKEDN